jgi:hypothetical protein
MNNVNIYDLYRGIQTKKLKRLECYEVVLEKCCTKIKSAANNEQFKIIYEVPEMVIGLPAYKIDYCIAFIIARLRKNGFIVEYIYPRALYVSWDLVELKRYRRMKQVKAIERITAEADDFVDGGHDFDGASPLQPTPTYDSPVPRNGRDRDPGEGALESYNELDQLIINRNNVPSSGKKAPFQNISKYKPSGKVVLNLT